MRSRCESVYQIGAQIVLALVREHLEAGDLDLHKLNEIEKMLAKSSSTAATYLNSVHEHCQASERLNFLVPLRTNAFGRIMLDPIESMFMTRHARFSEFQIANYFQIIEKIIGREKFEQYHNDMRELMQDEVVDKGENFAWDVFVEHSAVIRVRIATLGYIAKAFRNFPQRVLWFISIMEQSPDGNPGTVQFTEMQMKFLLLALFEKYEQIFEAEERLDGEILSSKDKENIRLVVQNSRKLGS